ncbi:hypothetical protein [Mucilaginibacter defluvii]|uniref:Uncharacterized protein n=1 Tax=Mucilaginibacter defluvii TaxID=1196019 RepID=A0ABP9FLZ0_9SPHI
MVSIQLSNMIRVHIPIRYFEGFNNDIVNHYQRFDVQIILNRFYEFTFENYPDAENFAANLRIEANGISIENLRQIQELIIQHQPRF